MPAGTKSAEELKKGWCGRAMWITIGASTAVAGGPGLVSIDQRTRLMKDVRPLSVELPRGGAAALAASCWIT